MRITSPLAGLTIVVATLLVGCTSVNRPLNRLDRPNESPRHNATRAATLAEVRPVEAKDPRRVAPGTPTTAASTRPELAVGADIHDTDGYFVGIAISGGGSRSANFAAGCMFELQRLGILQHVDYISTVSGGSMTGAYYCLCTDDEWNRENVEKRLTHSYASDLIWDTFMPWNWFVLGLSDYDRSDILAKSFRKHLFTRKGKELRFADLRADRPRLLINATDLQSGRRFIFCNETFDDINSDLAGYPISYAVAGSSSVPVLLHQVTLRDFSTVFKQYRHVIDGGIADNLGILTLVETYDAQVRAAERDGRANPYPKGAVLLVLDARTGYDAQLSGQGDTGLLQGLVYGAGLTSTALLNRASSATLAELIVKNAPDEVTAAKLRQQIQTLENDGYLEVRDKSGHPVRVLHIALSRLKDLSNLPFESFHESVNNIATYFNIEPTEAYHLYQAAELIVHEKFEGKLTEISKELSSR